MLTFPFDLQIEIFHSLLPKTVGSAKGENEKDMEKNKKIKQEKILHL